MNRDAIHVIKGPTLRSGHELVVGVIAVEKLVRHAHVPTHHHERSVGYQREAQAARVSRLAAELLEEKVDLPTSVLLSLRDVRFEDVAEKLDDRSYLLRLDPDKADAEHRLYVVDGQHRYLALKKALESGPRLRNFKVVFTCMIGATEDDEMEQFYVVNTNAKSVRTDLALHIMKERAHRDPGFAGGLREKGEGWKVLAQELTEALGRSSGCWDKRIRFPNSPKAETTIPSSGLAKSFKPIADRTLLFQGNVPTETRAQMIDAYWKAVREVYPEAFENPAGYNLQGAIGASTLHEVFPLVYELVRQNGGKGFTPECYRVHIEGPLLALEHVNGEGQVVSGADFWRKGSLGASAGFSSGAGKRVLAEMLKDLFPVPDFSGPPPRSEKV